ncbi:Peptide-N4-(N-acetyl-beta-glucosaminyl)asparagine amidase A [Lachnellula hyalina]|uniref:Peptide-N4-(N-acetyl-beta-glucosaminyl)asparagine amidase A n=1 Tax=Lachnellula hyalina TaxID=1316788 RepID=A0A8H8U528_9HELO|nr:Peptide-N4-(N-acetyl-beta-glucosaminyl)asparagine amidase A [Lachnellula hyalina]TVY30809.1 Peptide-N4-(N-acetyl-beta-glucosaminyl)asparagine amidase A [Lachnellula hyalina]
MSLDNLYDTVFTGAYNVTITALYYNDHQMISPANLILPISTQSSAQNKASVISLPDGNATVSFTLPRNAERAVVSVLASGNGAEEFWFRNVPTEYTDTFNNSALHAYSPFREVQVLIDGDIAGVGWPFPIIFTGGISPGIWVPIVGVHTYDLPSFEVDISPWLGILCDGMPHSFELAVVGYDSKTTFGTVGSNWWVSGSVFVWKDAGGNQTTGTAIESSSAEPSFQLTPNIISTSNANTSLELHLSAQRVLSHTSTITTSSGPHTLSWSQSLSYSSINSYTANGSNKTISALTTGTSSFSPSSKYSPPIKSTLSYPITFRTSSTTPVDATTANSTIVASLDRSLLSNSVPILSYLTAPAIFEIPHVLATRQIGSSVYYWNDTYYEFAGAIDPAMGTSGSTEQWYSAVSKVGVYGRHVKAVDGYEPVLVVDEEFPTTLAVPDTELVGIGK